MTMSVEEIIESYIRNEFEIGDDPDFSNDIHLFDSGFVDSLGATTIVMYIEKEFDIQITQKDLMKYPMNTVEEIAAVVEQKLSEKE